MSIELFRNSFSKAMKVISAIERANGSKHTYQYFRPYWNYRGQCYSLCKLLNCVATQWRKHLVPKINDKEYAKAHYYKLKYLTDTYLWKVWVNGDHKKLGVTVKSLKNLIWHGVVGRRSRHNYCYQKYTWINCHVK